MPKPLDEYRKELNMSMEEFAYHLGITARTYYHITRRGGRAHYSTIRKIARNLSVDPSQITEFAPEPIPAPDRQP